MHRVLVVVEGQTERGIVEQVIAPYLALRELDVRGKLLGDVGHKGGNVRFNRVAGDVLNLLKQETTSTVSTFVDLYQLESDWPGVPAGCGRRPLLPVPVQSVPAIESAVYAQINARFGGNLQAHRFVPYIQVHEVEALFFAKPVQLAAVFARPDREAACVQIVQECGGCEKINHGENTHPAARIQALFGRYRKGDGARSDAILIAKAVGVEAMRAACPRFNAWLSTIEGFASCGEG